MNKKNLAYLASLIIVGALAIGIPFIFDNNQLVNTMDVFQYYLATKIGFYLILVAAVVIEMKKEVEDKYYRLVIGLLLVVQIVPLLIRLSLKLKDFQSGLAMIISIVSLMAILVMVIIIPGVKKHLKENKKGNN